MKNKIVLAYSADWIQVSLKWLQTEYNADIYAALGQGAELTEAKIKAKKLVQKYTENLKEEFVVIMFFQCFEGNTIYEGEYLLGTSIARPLIAKDKLR